MNTLTIKQQIINAFNQEFSFIRDKFEIMNLLANGTEMNSVAISNLKLPSDNYNIVWHPGVYVFIGNNCVYRVGVSMRNSRARVMEHLNDWTTKNGHCVWDIDNYEDKSILLFNVKEQSNRHWLLALEVFLETKFNPLINAERTG